MEETADPADFATAFEAAFARFQVGVEAACAGDEDWPSGVAAAIGVALDFAAADPTAADVLTNQAMAAGREGIACYRRLLSYVAGRLLPGRQARPHVKELPETTEQMIAGGLAALVAERVATGRAAELPAMTAEAVQFALTPYLGVEEAKRVAGASTVD